MQLDGLLKRRGSEAIVTPRSIRLSRTAFRESRRGMVSVWTLFPPAATCSEMQDKPGSRIEPCVQCREGSSV